MAKTPRAIIVGGGQNGLSAAITLAERGWDAQVLEATEHLGGAVRSAELTEPGFMHDVYSAVHPAAVSSPVFERWPLRDHGLRWVHPPVVMAHPLDDGTAPALHRSVADTRRALDAIAPGDGSSWEAFITPYVAKFEAFRRVMLGKFPPVTGGLRLAAGLRISGLLEFARVLLSPASGLANDLFRHDAPSAWLYGSALHSDVGPLGSGSGIAAAYLKLMGHARGWPSPAGGAQELTNALASHLHSLGGRTRTGAQVTRIVAAGDRVGGVELAGGERLSADVVVADLTAGRLTEVAREVLPSEMLTKLRRFRPGPGTFKLDWALDDPIPWSADPARRAGTVHVGGSAGEIARAVAEVELGNWPERPFLLAGQQSLADPLRAPEGKHTAWAYTRTPGYGDAAVHERHAERVEAQIERFAPGFRDRIIARHVATPSDLEAGNANLAAGDVGGGSYSLDQVVFRPIPSLAPYRTGLRGLYLGSASAFPGGAVHGVPGHAAALAAHRDRQIRRV